MATVSEWIQGARPRTLPNAISPVVVGVGAGARIDDVVWWKAALALVVSMALIIGAEVDRPRPVDDENEERMLRMMLDAQDRG